MDADGTQMVEETLGKEEEGELNRPVKVILKTTASGVELFGGEHKVPPYRGASRQKES